MDADGGGWGAVSWGVSAGFVSQAYSPFLMAAPLRTSRRTSWPLAAIRLAALQISGGEEEAPLLLRDAHKGNSVHSKKKVAGLETAVLAGGASVHHLLHVDARLSFPNALSSDDAESDASAFATQHYADNVVAMGLRSSGNARRKPD